MKDQVISSIELDTRIRKVVLKTSKKFRENHLSQKGCLDSSLALESNLPVGLRFSSRKFKFLLGYLVIYHYFPAEKAILCYYHLDLLDHLESSESYWLSVLMNKKLFLKYLEEQKTITVQQFFAGICNDKTLITLIENIKLSFEEKMKTPRRIVRRKGYRDKGSLGREDSRILKEEINEDFYLTMYQYELEEKKLIRSAESLLLKEHLSEGRVLTDELLVKFHLIPCTERSNSNESKRDFTAKDYCKQRAREEIIRQEEQDLRAAEKARAKTFESRVIIKEPRKQRGEGK